MVDVSDVHLQMNHTIPDVLHAESSADGFLLCDFSDLPVDILPNCDLLADLGMADGTFRNSEGPPSITRNLHRFLTSRSDFKCHWHNVEDPQRTV